MKTHSRHPPYIISAYWRTVIFKACNHAIYQSGVPFAPSRVQNKQKTKTSRRITVVFFIAKAVLRWINEPYDVFMQLLLVLVFFYDYCNSSKFSYLLHVLLTQLTFCVSALYMFLGIMSLFFLFLEGVVWPSDRASVRVQSCRSCPQLLFGLLYSVEKGLSTSWGGEEEERGGGGGRRRSVGLYRWSCIRLHYYSIWCAICDSWMFPVYLCSLRPTPTQRIKTSRVTPPPLQTQDVTMMQ